MKLDLVRQLFPESSNCFLSQAVLFPESGNSFLTQDRIIQMVF